MKVIAEEMTPNLPSEFYSVDINETRGQTVIEIFLIIFYFTIQTPFPASQSNI
jgi:hypothetical protein